LVAVDEASTAGNPRFIYTHYIKRFSAIGCSRRSVAPS
jgi:hypothetical protein